MSRRRAEPPATLALAQGTAELRPDPDRTRAWTLLVDGTPQSHVDLDDPTYLEFEYIRWLAEVAGLAGTGPLNVLHLGGGAWTLARHLAAIRPGSRQRVVEIDGALADFVRTHLPSASGAGIRVRIGDARQVLETLAPASVDLLVVDVFAGARIPAHLTSVEFMRACARVLRPDGISATNLADGAPLAFARGQAATLASVFGTSALIAPPRVLRGRGFGNLVLVGTHPGGRPVTETGLEPSEADRWLTLGRRLAADPFPARLVIGADFTRFRAGARVVTDEIAVASPSPVKGLFDRP